MQLAREEAINPDTKTAFAGDWPNGLFDVLKAGAVRQVAFVPDAGHSRLIRLCEANDAMKVVRLTTEEEGIALLAGAWFGGDRGVLLMQSSGVGNCINMLSLPNACQIPLLMLITMRGDWGEFNPWQVYMGSATQTVLEAMNVAVRRADRAEDIAPAAKAMLDLAYFTYRPTAVLIGQRVLGAKNFKELTK
jgi:sulfopyruvate decarboxylase alpha subunit